METVVDCREQTMKLKHLVLENPDLPLFVYRYEGPQDHISTYDHYAVVDARVSDIIMCNGDVNGKEFCVPSSEATEIIADMLREQGFQGTDKEFSDEIVRHIQEMDTFYRQCVVAVVL